MHMPLALEHILAQLWIPHFEHHLEDLRQEDHRQEDHRQEAVCELMAQAE
jgi:hypothetical protein